MNMEALNMVAESHVERDRKPRTGKQGGRCVGVGGSTQAHSVEKEELRLTAAAVSGSCELLSTRRGCPGAGSCAAEGRAHRRSGASRYKGTGTSAERMGKGAPTSERS